MFDPATPRPRDPATVVPSSDPATPRPRDLATAVPLYLIAALDEDGAIGKGNTLPWHIPEDLAWFKQKTKGHSLVMGRRCWESIGCRPLPGRPTVVLSRNPDLHYENAKVYGTIEHAIAHARVLGEQPPFICGGADIYAAAMPYVTRMYLTAIPGRHGGEVLFPRYDVGDWSEEFAVPGKTPGVIFRAYARRL